MMLDRGIPSHLVNLQLFWYSRQGFLFKWGISRSFGFGSSYSYSYTVFTDLLSGALTDTGVGCYIHN